MAVYSENKKVTLQFSFTLLISSNEMIPKRHTQFTQFTLRRNQTKMFSIPTNSDRHIANCVIISLDRRPQQNLKYTNIHQNQWLNTDAYFKKIMCLISKVSFHATSGV